MPVIVLLAGPSVSPEVAAACETERRCVLPLLPGADQTKGVDQKQRATYHRFWSLSPAGRKAALHAADAAGTPASVEKYLTSPSSIFGAALVEDPVIFTRRGYSTRFVVFRFHV